MKLKRILLFPGVNHNIKKPKPKKPFTNLKPQKLKNVSKRETVRDKIRNNFDFSRTPYALVIKKPRIALSEEISRKRKFFKTAVAPQHETKIKTQVEEPISVSEFDDLNEIEEEPLKKDISSIINYMDWLDDEETMKPQITRKEANDFGNEEPAVRSYITLTSVSSPEVSSGNGGIVDTAKESENDQVDDTSANVRTYKVTSEISCDTQNDIKENIENRPTDNNYFSIFKSSPTTLKNALSDVTNKIKKPKINLVKAAAPNDQYQIDAGQKIIGPKECKKCGMVYDIGDPIDEERHIKYHQNLDDLKYKGLKPKDVVGYCGTDCIMLIQETDAKHKREKVLSILKRTEDEMGTSYTVRNFWKAFVYVRNDNILGCLVAEPLVNAYRVIQSDGIIILSEESYSVKCGINRIWVKSKYRRQRIATELLNCMRKNFVYGEYLQIDDVAFSATTPEGHALAKKYTGRDNYLSYLEAES